MAELAGIPVHVPEDLASDTVMHASAEEEREAELDQYAGACPSHCSMYEVSSSQTKAWRHLKSPSPRLVPILLLILTRLQ